MAKKTNTKTAPNEKAQPEADSMAEAQPEELDAGEPGAEGSIEEVDVDVEELDVELPDVAAADDGDAVVDLDGDIDDETEVITEGEAGGPALDELESEELEMLTEDEESEVIQVDEAAEMRAIRREELALEKDAESATSNEFVCQSCFLVKRTSQLADKRRKICKDCAA